MRQMTSLHSGANVPVHIQRGQKEYYNSKQIGGKKKKRGVGSTNNNNNDKGNHPETPLAISGPKRALKNDLSNLNIKIESIIR